MIANTAISFKWGGEESSEREFQVHIKKVVGETFYLYHGIDVRNPVERLKPSILKSLSFLKELMKKGG